MRLNKLTLKNYRCFESIDIDFDDQLTVLVAKNGMGKTSILDAIAVAFGPYIGAFDESVGKGFDGERDIRLRPVRKTTSADMEPANGGIILKAEGEIPSTEKKEEDIKVTWSRHLARKELNTTIKDAKELVKCGKYLQSEIREINNNTKLPLFACYGTNRLWQQKKDTKNKFKSTSRTIGYTDSLDMASNYKALINWFHYWSEGLREAHDKNDEKQRVEFEGYIKSVQSAVNICLSCTEWKEIEYSFAKKQLLANHQEHGKLPVSHLSDGIRNMIGMVADIAFRATKLNPQFGSNATKETSGIVLIDEVDMHLHPEWQQTILESLTKAFPKIQFIVTTHSPQVLSCVNKKSIRILREETYSHISALREELEEADSDIQDNDFYNQQKTIVVEEVQQQTRGVSSADLLAKIMGVNSVPNISESRWLSEYYALIAQNLHETERGKEIRSDLEKHFEKNHPVIYECDRMIRFQAFKQKLYKKD